MPNTSVLAAATGLPSSPPRRGFLGGLVSLPLVGGAVTLIGQPTASAEPVTPDMLATYSDWLFYERRVLMSEMAAYDPPDARRLGSLVGDRSDDFHFPGMAPGWMDIPQPSTRAALVLSTVGCDWRRDGR